MINTLFGSGNSLGKCRLHGAPRINRARRGRCSSSSREERRVVIIPRETGHPDSSLVQTDFSFFFFFFLPFSSWLCKHQRQRISVSKGKDSRRIRGGIRNFSLSLFLLESLFQPNRIVYLHREFRRNVFGTTLIRSSIVRLLPDISPSPSLSSFHSRECSLLRRFNRIATENFYTIPSVLFAEESDGTRKTDLPRLEKNFEKDETNFNANQNNRCSSVSNPR